MRAMEEEIVGLLTAEHVIDPVVGLVVTIVACGVVDRRLSAASTHGATVISRPKVTVQQRRFDIFDDDHRKEFI